jgi:hypothetical protein
MKSVAITMLTLGGIPLLAYPFVALASIMSLAAERTGKEPLTLTLVATAAQLSSLLYPLAYLCCLVLAIRRLRNNEPAARISVTPLISLGFIIALFTLWRAMDTR